MKSLKIKRSNLPSMLPINMTAVWYLLLDKFQPPGWVWGVAACLLVLAWIGTIISMINETEIDLLKSRD